MILMVFDGVPYGTKENLSAKGKVVISLDVDKVGQLPMASVDNKGYIHDNVKPHAFAVYDDESPSRSLCKKYSQWTKDYEEINIEGVEEKYLCKKCLERYKKLD